jgi:iron complex outermembrane receptor protein
MIRSIVLTCVVFLLLIGAAFSQEEKESKADSTVMLEKVVITAPEDPATINCSMDEIRMKRDSSVSEIVVDQPGISGVRRGGNAPEPVIRGLGYERVQTQVGAVPIYGGCPSRMDPAATYIPSHAVRSVRVLKGLPSVVEGPAGTAGRILVNTDYERDPDSGPEVHGFAKGFAESAREGGGAEAGIQGGTDRIDASLSVGYTDLNSYDSPSGIEVPANFEESSIAASAGIRTAKNHRWSNSFIYVDETDIEFPSLPMDNIDSDFYLYNTGYRIRFESGPLEQIKVEGGFSLVDHFMDNSLKPNRGTLISETDSDSNTYAARAFGDLRFDNGLFLTAGFDFFTLGRDATRRRETVGGPTAGQVFFDRLWPDAEQTDAGMFAEANYDLTSELNLRAGLRGDVVVSDASAANSPSLRRRTVLQNYIDFNGPEASDVDRTEWTGAGNIVLEWDGWKDSVLYGGVGVSSRAAGVTERFFAFAPSPGGFSIGNPALDPEVKYEIDAGITWRKPRIETRLSGFASYVTDYIYSTQVAFQDVNGDGVSDIIRGYRNIDAYLYGAELGISAKIIEHVTIPVRASWVAGRNDSNGRDLPEIPPLEILASVIVDGGRRVPWWAEFGGRFVTRQDRIDPTFPEDETPAFNVFHVRGGATLAKSVRLEAGIENLFDKTYNEHLTRESAFTYAGGLLAGAEIPEPERSFYLTLRYEF